MDIDSPEDPEDIIMASQSKDPGKIAATRAKAKEIKIKQTTRVTARQIDEISYSRKLVKDAKQALESISKKDVALSLATSIDQVDAATKARRDATDPIRKFNKTPSLMKLKRTQRHRTKCAWAKVASDIRDRATQNAVESAPTPETPPPKTDPKTGYCEACGEYESEKIGSGNFHHPETCVKHKPEVRLVGCLGDAGTGFGSRLGGHSRRGGGKLRAEHRQNATVAMTDEHLTSKTCPFCFQRTRPAKGRRIVGEEIKTVSINGAMECTNQHCESFQAGYTIKSRDGQASHNIGTTGGYTLLSVNKEAMPPFCPYERQRLAGSSTRIQHLHDDAMNAPLVGI
ncbi:MAG: hypothetical protein J3Q66DRAFT_119334 [Benniella sp.]|nr:MAG: hypothetical protein J3Q66DRAFT_119334 [Benniella sp.]